MANFMAGSTNGAFSSLDRNRLEVISVLLNNNCNLSCKHCYLQTERFAPYLNADDWSRFFESALTDVEPSIVTFVGKEVCLNARTLDVVLQTVKQRNAIQGSDFRTQIGMITNGTLIHKYYDQLLETAPDYIDVSIDGLPGQHDQIRGASAYEQLSPNLSWLTRHFPNRIWAIHTLFENNIQSLPKFLDYYHGKYALNHFAIGLYKPLYYTDQALRILQEQYIDFADNILPSLQHLELKNPVKICLELDITQMGLIEIMTDRGWARPRDDISTRRHSFDNGLTIEVNTARIPTGLWRSVRITPEGYYLAAEDIVNVREYKERMVGSIKGFDYNAQSLYMAGIHRVAASQFAL